MSPVVANFADAVQSVRATSTSSYKAAWARAIVELCQEHPDADEFGLDQIAASMLKSYWNQTIFFDLRQSSNPAKPAELVQIVKTAIEAHFATKQDRRPVGFARARVKIETERATKVLKKDVSYRFTKQLRPESRPYRYEKGDDSITDVRATPIAQNSKLLLRSIDLVWAQVLEDFNPATPRIANKVAAVADGVDLKRSSLRRFRVLLDVGQYATGPGQ